LHEHMGYVGNGGSPVHFFLLHVMCHSKCYYSNALLAPHWQSLLRLFLHLVACALALDDGNGNYAASFVCAVVEQDIKWFLPDLAASSNQAAGGGGACHTARARARRRLVRWCKHGLGMTAAELVGGGRGASSRQSATAKFVTGDPYVLKLLFGGGAAEGAAEGAPCLCRALSADAIYASKESRRRLEASVLRVPSLLATLLQQGNAGKAPAVGALAFEWVRRREGRLLRLVLEAGAGGLLLRVRRRVKTSYKTDPEAKMEEEGKEGGNSCCEEGLLSAACCSRGCCRNIILLLLKAYTSTYTAANKQAAPPTPPPLRPCAPAPSLLRLYLPAEQLRAVLKRMQTRGSCRGRRARETLNLLLRFSMCAAGSDWTTALVDAEDPFGRWQK
jgi:hypothetical protein